MMFYIYILYSESADKYYVGYTDDLNRRLNEHNKISVNSYTSKYRPWILKACFLIGEDRGTALKIEKHIKRKRSRAYIENIIAQESLSKLVEKYSSVG